MNDRLKENSGKMLRAPGRPAQAEGIKAKENLLDAAVLLFSFQGVAATSTRLIAQQCGVTPAMVQYYFSSREKLMDAVFNERISRFIDHVFEGFSSSKLPVEAMVRKLVDRIFDAVEIMPWMPSIWIRDIVSEGGAFRERMLEYLRHCMEHSESVTGIGEMRSILYSAYRNNELNSGVRPELIQVSVIGLVMFPLATQGFWSRLPGMQEVSREQIRCHAQALLATGVTGGMSSVVEKELP